MNLLIRVFPVLSALCALFLMNDGAMAQNSTTGFAGGSLSYTHVAGDTFTLTADFYVRCDKSAPTTGSIIVRDCSNNFLTSLNISSPTSSEISDQVCGNTDCGAGTFSGRNMYRYTVQFVDTFTADCFHFVGLGFTRDTASRNLVVPTTSAGWLYIEGELDRAVSAFNSSPVFAGEEAPYICNTGSVSYDPIVTDADGDSLVFTLISARATAIGVNMSYETGFSGSAPISGITIDTATGVLNFTAPSDTGSYTVVIQVEEYDTAGQYIGNTIRDFQFVVVSSCSNVGPSVGASLFNVTNATLDANYEVTIDTGSNGCFSLVFTGDVGETVTVDTSAFEAVIPDAVANISTVNHVTTVQMCWTPGAGDAGSYTFSLSADDGACPFPGTAAQSITVNVEEPSPFIITGVSTVNNTCPTTPNGQVNITFTGGDGPYYFSVIGQFSGDTTTQTSPNFTSLSGDIYRIYAIDSGTLADTTTPGFIYAVGTSAFAITGFTVNSQVSCDNACDGGLTVTPNTLGAGGSLSAYSYAWSNGQTSRVITGVCGGTHTVTVTDTSGCALVDQTTIVEPPVIYAQVDSTDSAGCNGDSTGAAYLSAFGGFAPSTSTASYVIDQTQGSFEPYGFGESFNTTGYTTVNLTDDIHSSAINIGFDFDFFGSTMTQFVIGSNGYISFDLTLANAAGGSSTFQSPTMPANSNPNNAIAAYWEDLDPDNGAEGTIEYYRIGSAPRRALVVNFIDVPHFPGGVDSVTFQIVLYETSNIIQIFGIDCPSDGGTHVQGIENAAGTVSFTTPGRNNTDFDLTNDYVAFIPESQDFDYTWSSIGSDSIATNLLAGNYTVTVTDPTSSLGCNDTVEFTIHEPVAVSITSITNEPTCNGDNDGSITASASGGNGGPYTYAWNTSGNTATINGLIAGTYTVTATDNSGCTAADTIVLGEPTIVDVTLAETDVSCNGGSDGSITATGSGGSGAFTYAWSNSGTGATINNLVAGTYTVTATDGNGCTDTASVTLTEPATAVSVSTSTTSESCSGAANGTATATGSGGTGTITYAWNTGGNTATITGLTAGTYTVTATDANGCTDTASAVVASGGVAVSVSITSSSDISCFGGNDGDATAGNASGGTGPYTYAWSTGATGQSISSLTAGTYTITATDNNGCEGVDSVTLTEPASAVDVSITVGSTISCNGGSNGELCGNGSGGTAGYSYVWSNGGNTVCISNIAAGTYTVTVTDANGCTDLTDMIISEPTAVVASIVTNQPSCAGDSGSAIASGAGGTPGYTYAWSNGGTTDSIGGLIVGSYTVTVTDANGCTDTESTTISNAGSITLNMSSTDVSCNGGNDGTATASASGGAGSFTYAWSNSGTGATITGLTAGTYTVTATDGNGCTATSSVAVGQPATSVSATVATTDVSCNGDADGTASAIPSGGTPGYTYSWSNASTDSTATGLTANTYTVTVTDANGCTATASGSVSEPSALFAFTNVILNPSCASSADGSVQALQLGGTAGYTYLWNTGATTSVITGLTADTYTVTVTDANGCTDAEDEVLAAPNPMSLTMGFDSASCNGAADGTAYVTVTGGTTPYTYAWSTTSTNDSIFNLVAATYTVTVTDSNGCTEEDSVTVLGGTGVTLSVAGTNPTCAGDSTGSATATATGSGAITYAWSNGGTGATINNLPAGTYTVTATDASGCTEEDSTTIVDPTAITFTGFSGISHPSCDDACDGAGTAVASGGTGSLSYAWSSGSSSAAASGLCGGTHTVTVTDASGCTMTDMLGLVEPPSIFGVVDSTFDALCAGDASGAAYLSAYGGTVAPTSTAAYVVDQTEGEFEPYPHGEPWNAIDYQSFNLNDDANTDSIEIFDGGDFSFFGQTKTYFAISSQGLITFDMTQLNTGQVNGMYSTTNAIPFNGGTQDPRDFIGAYWHDLDPSASADSRIETYVLGTTPDRVRVVNFIHIDHFANTSPQIYSTFQIALYETSGIIQIHSDSLNSDGGNHVQGIENAAEDQAYAVPGRNNTNFTATDDYVAFIPTTQNFTYTWSSIGSGSSSTSLTAGNYTVTVSDGICNDTVEFTINNPAVVVASIDSTLDPACAGDSTGVLIASGSGGSGPYTYSWNNGDTDSINNGLPAGTYSVTVTDANGCTDSTSFTLQNGVTVSISMSSSNSFCAFCVGSASASPSGGQSPYTYLWSTAQTSNTINNLCSGPYSVTVTDDNGCTSVNNTTVNDPFTPNINGSSSDASCANTCDGELYSNYTCATCNDLEWFVYPDTTNLVGTGDTLTGICAGTYLARITNFGCQGFDTVVVGSPTAITTTITSTDAGCSGGSTGTATASVSGGTPGYTYLWSTTDTTSSISGLSAGNYSVIVTDANGCMDTAAVTINAPSSITTSVGSISGVSCFGDSDGSATATPSGGTAPYSYIWSSGETSATAITLSGGTQCVTVTDDSNCTDTVCVTIPEPADLTLSTSTTDPSCAGDNDGQASVTPSGGTAGYTYSWSTTATTASITGLTAGNYTVTVTDANGCTETATVSLTDPTAVAVNTSSTDANCNGGNDGTATATGSGGTGTFTYAWSNAGTGATITGLTAGTYTVTATDGNGCTAVGTATVGEPAASVVAAIDSILNNDCFGAADGFIVASGSGGTGPYNYSWNTGSIIDSATNLTAGTYSVTVTDANGCTDSTSATVTQPATGMTASISSTTDVSCNGGNDGSATATTSGATGSVTYVWPTGTGATVNGLTAGSYTVTATDASGCTATATATINEPTVVSLTMASTDPSCAGDADGTASASASGGTPGYTYAWSTSGTGASINGLTAGTYVVTATDANGCTAVDSVTLTDPTAVAVSTSATNASCNGGNDGTATATGSGGDGTFTYAWSNSGTGATITGLTAGTYTVTVTDGNGCTAVGTATVGEPASAVLASIDSIHNNDCFGAADGFIVASGSGGTGPYNYNWNTGSIIDSANNLTAGTYSVTVTDANGCTDSTSATVSQPATGMTASITSTTNVTCNGGSNGSATATTAGATGTVTYVWPTGTGATVNGLTAGSYTVTATDASGCTATATAIITEPTPVVGTITDIDTISCNGLADGCITMMGSGGTGPYTYSWSTGCTGTQCCGLLAGTYTVTISDANNCTTVVSTDTLMVTEPAGMSNTFSGVQPSSCTSCTGQATANVSGGAGGYTYAWPNSQTGMAATLLCQGINQVTVTDLNGCVDSFNVVINSDNADSISAAGINPTCTGSSDGIVFAQDTCVGGCTYVWTDSASGNVVGNADTAFGLPGGTYIVQLTNASGCVSSDTVTLIEPAGINAMIMASTDVSCLGGNDGSATANATGGTGTYTYTWPTGGGATINGLTAGTYTVTATDGNGCTDTASVVITEPATGLSVTAAVLQNVSCNGGNDGSAYAIASGGTGTITYSWNNGALNGDTITGLTAGTYTVVVSDAGSCTATDQVTITEPTVVIGVIDSTSDPSCFGDADGSATVSGSGGTPGYTYLWPTGGTAQTETGLTAGTYCVTISDANSCQAIICVTINNPTGITNNFTGITNSSCTVCDGTATANPSGGNGSTYTFLWANGQTTATNDSLCAGANNVTITDSAGCTTVDVVLINADGADTVFADSIDASCGSCDGIAYAAYSCNDGPCTVSWTAFGDATVLGTTDSIDSLCAGVYVVELTNNSGCVSVDMVTVNSPSPIDPGATVTDASCAGICDGSIALSPTGGAGSGYTFMWNTGSTNSSLTGLCAGSYTVTVGDGTGCDTIVTYLIDAPSSIVANGVSANASCFGICDGTITLTPSGGGGSYSYNWSPVPANGQGVQAATGLCAGDYYVTVTDVNGCTVLDTFNISEPTEIVQTVSAVTDAACGVCDGTIGQTIGGGAGGYTYLWSNGDTTSSVDSLCFGFYDVTVTDANGCTAVFGYPVSETNGPSISLAGVNASASGQCDGTATATVTSSQGTVTFMWSNGDTSATADSLCAGIHIVTATDANGCSTVDTITITEPDLMSISFTVADITCTGGGCDGEITVNVNGGVMPYTFLWNTGDTTATIDSLCAGTYTVTVTDLNGTMVIDSVMLSDPSSLNIASAVTNTSCPGSCDGSIALTITGGVPTILWSTGDTTSVLDSLCAGVYSVVITDTTGCSDSLSFTITSPPDISATLQSITNPDCQLANGSISVAAGGGNGTPYTYLWLDASLDTLLPMQTSGTAINLFAGIYNVQITDSNGCMDTFNVILNNANAPTIALDSIIDVSCFGECDGAVLTTITGGTTPYTILWSSGGTMEDDSNLCAGPDTIAVADANLCLSFDIFEVEQPQQLSVRYKTETSVTCGSTCDGTLSVSIAGGTEPYTYNWSNGGTDSTITDLCAGTYTVTVTDANGCTLVDNGTVSGPTALVITVDSTFDATCSYTGDGGVFITVTGGTPPYTYAWDDGNGTTLTGQDLANALPGTYVLTVTSAIGCTALDTFVISTRFFVDVTAMDDVEVCPLTTGIVLTGTDSSASAVRWLSESGVVLSNGNSVSVSSVADTNIFIFEGLDSVCISRDTVLVLQSSGPGIDAGPDKYIEPGASITIGGSPTANSGVGVTWVPATDINSVTTANPTVFPLETTVYYVSGTDGNGCYGLDSVTVTVEKLVDPVGGFSPNGDGINEVFYIERILNYPNAIVQIFNRWGNLIYESDPGYTNPWNGKFQGKQLPVGTYYYVIDLNDDAVNKLITGPITILK